MKHLKTHEGFEVGDFKTFISKYKKTGYISRTDMKRMDATDMKFEYFDRIITKVDKCYDFFNINDFTLLSDLMLDVYDEFPTIDSDKVRYSFGVSYEDRVDYSVGYISTSVDDKGNQIIPYLDNKHAGLKDKKDVIQSIINGVVVDREVSIRTTEHEIIDRPSYKREIRAGIEDPNISKLRNLKTRNPWRNLNIKAYLYIDIKLSESNFNWRLHDQNNERYYMIDNFKKLTKTQLERYFSMLDSDYKFEVGCNDFYNNNYPRIAISITI